MDTCESGQPSSTGWPYRLLPDDAYDDATTVALEAAYHEADAESVAASREFRRALAALALASTGITMAFLLYDEAELIWMLLVCGALLVFARLAQRQATRLDCHRRFIEQRALAEALRVQLYLRYAGSALAVADLLTWTQLEETPWIAERLRTLTSGASPTDAHPIRDCWVEGQRRYHQRAIASSERAVERSQRVVRTAFVASVALYAFALAFELTCGGLIFAPSITVADIGVWRAGIKIALGTVSAATLLISSYYGRLSLERVHGDHIKMERFYARAAELLDTEGQTDALLERLAREELIENGNWYSYQLDNTPTLDL